MICDWCGERIEEIEQRAYLTHEPPTRFGNTLSVVANTFAKTLALTLNPDRGRIDYHFHDRCWQAIDTIIREKQDTL